MFELDARLASDCSHVGDLPLCRVLLMNDSQYPWLILVPRSEGARELIDLSAADQQRYLAESNVTAQILLSTFAAEKLNIAALGNVVPQLHIHHIARYQTDPVWPRPVWGALVAKPYAEEDLDALLGTLKAAYFAAEPAFRAVS